MAPTQKRNSAPAHQQRQQVAAAAGTLTQNVAAGPQAVAKQVTTAVKGEPPIGDRHKDKLAEIAATAVWGVNIGDVVEAKTGENFTKNIKRAITMEYFTQTQFVSGLYWSIIIGMFIGAILVVLFSDEVGWRMTKKTTVVFSFAFFWGWLFSYGMASRSYKKCDSSKNADGSFKIKGIDPRRRSTDDGGKPDMQHCLDDDDCSIGTKPSAGSCKATKPPKFVHWARNLGGLVSLVIGIIALIQVGPRWDGFGNIFNFWVPRDLSSTDTFLSIIFGFFGGTLWTILTS
jgi:MFS family permease